MTAAGRLLVIALVPSAVAVAVLWLPRLLAALRRRMAPPAGDLLPAGPPLEQLAADLRRLLAEHARVRAAPDVPVRAARLAALEGAITDTAVAAAKAVGVQPPPREGRAPLPDPALRALLDELSGAGLVLTSSDGPGR